MSNKLTKDEKKYFFLGLIAALSLSIFANFFVSSFFNIMQIKNYDFYNSNRTVLIASSLAMAILFNWFYKKI